jgi:hypothetical protein
MKIGLIICLVENKFKEILYKDHINKYKGFHKEINQRV